MKLTPRQQAIVDLLWGTLKKSHDHPDRADLPTGTKTKLGLAKTVERIFAEYPDDPQNYDFTCPSCGKSGRIEAQTQCDGVQSEILRFVPEGHLPVGEAIPVWGAEYTGGIGYGDVYGTTFQCPHCGHRLDAEDLEDLVELDCVTLHTNPD